MVTWKAVSVNGQMGRDPPPTPPPPRRSSQRLKKENTLSVNLAVNEYNFLESGNDKDTEMGGMGFSLLRLCPRCIHGRPLIHITLKCLSIGTPNAINFPFVSNEKLFFLGVPVFKHIVMRLKST